MTTPTHIISWITFLPLAFGLVLLVLPKDAKRMHWITAMAGTLVTLATSLCLASRYHSFWLDSLQPGMSAGTSVAQFPVHEYANWIPKLGINYAMGVDGIGLLMLLMTTIIFPFAVGVSYKEIQDKTKMFYFLILLVETAILGVFSALNLILFYMFYEAMLIPLYFIVGVWGGANRIRASIKFFLYTMVGSMLMLVAMLGIYFLTGSFDYGTVSSSLAHVFGQRTIWGLPGHTVEMLLFLGFFAAFAVKAPLWPFHSWVPDAYSEAPTAGSIILVALKMGLYGFIRFNIALFPHATQAAAPIIVVLAVIGVIYAAIVAAVQIDLKRLIAYSSISHVGVIVLAIFSLTTAGMTGAVIQMVSHTVTTGALFILVAILYARRGSYLIADYGGVWKVMPVFAAFFLLATLSSIALPGTAGFSGEFMMLIGAFQSYPWEAGFATTAAVWSVVYMLWMFQRVMHGKIDKPEVQQMTDLTFGDWLALAPLAALILLIGVAPIPIERPVNTSVANLLSRNWLPDRGDSRELHYLPLVVDHHTELANHVTAVAYPVPEQ